MLRQLLAGIVHGETNGLFTGHVVSFDDRTLGIDRSARGLSRSRGSRGRLVLVGLEEGHSCRCVVLGWLIGGRGKVLVARVAWIAGLLLLMMMLILWWERKKKSEGRQKVYISFLAFQIAF